MPSEAAPTEGVAGGMSPPPRLTVAVGQYSYAGAKPVNQDFHGCLLPDGAMLATKGMAFAIADGISTSRRGAEAAETAVVSFLTDYYATPETWSPRSSAERVIAAVNSWMHGQNSALARHREVDPDRTREAEGLIATFTALILRGSTAHILHLGDAMVARVEPQGLEILTEAHRVPGGGGHYLLARALGMGRHVEIDYRQFAVQPGDTILIATDGVGDALSPREIAALVAAEADPEAAARGLCEAALEAGAADNLTAQLVRILSTGTDTADDLLAGEQRLPAPPDWHAGEACDGYVLVRPLHLGGRSQLWLARDSETGQMVALKRLARDLTDDPQAREGLLREEWVLRGITSPHVIAAPSRRFPRSALYTVSDYFPGQTLEQWHRDNACPDIAVVREIISQIARGLYAFERRQIVHRDLRPANIMIDADGTVQIIDLGSARVAGIDDPADAPGDDAFAGTQQFSAPELYRGLGATPQSDLWSLAAIAYFLLTGHLPLGPRMAAANTLSQQRRLRYVPVSTWRDDVPDWIDAALAHALHVEPHLRYQEVSAFVHDLNVPNTSLAHPEPAPLLQRNPVLFWQAVSSLLAAALLFVLV